MSTISQRIREAMETNGMKQVELSRKTGISRSNISYYCSGEYEPKGANLYKIASALSVTVAWLIGDDAPDPTDRELWDMREACRQNPDTRRLFDLARNATPADVRAAIAVLEALRGDADA